MGQLKDEHICNAHQISHAKQEVRSSFVSFDTLDHVRLGKCDVIMLILNCEGCLIYSRCTNGNAMITYEFSSFLRCPICTKLHLFDSLMI